MNIQVNRLVRYILPLLVLGIVLLLWIVKSRDLEEEVRTMELPVVIVKGENGSLAKTLKVSGLVQSPDQVTAVARVPGRVDRVPVEVGQKVHVGDVLAGLDGESYRLAMLQARAAFEAAESNYLRVSSLYESQSASQEAYNQSRAQYEGLKSQYDLARLQLDYTEITSPIDGSVLMTHVNPGAMAGRETALVTLGSLTGLTLETRVPEAYLPFFIGENPRLIAQVTHPELTSLKIKASLKSTAPYVSAQTRDFAVTLLLEDNDLLRPGMLLHATYNLEIRDNMITLPRRVLAEDRWIWHVDDEGRARRLEYTPLFETDTRIAVPESWKDYRFILEGQYFLSPGQIVKVQG